MTSKSNPSYENMNITGKCSAVDDGSGEIMLFGVRVKVDPMRKSVSMNNLSQYVQIQPGGPIISSNNSNNNSNSNNNLDSSAIAAAADSGYPSADDAGRNPSNSGLGRKRGVPWTEDEHKLFLLGLEKVGKGDWRGISRNFVKTRTPTQVASHAQKYYLRRSNLNRRRRRSSLFDITTDSVAAGIRMEEDQDRVNIEDSNSQFVTVSPLSGFPMAATVNLVPSPPPAIENQTKTETETLTEDQMKTGPTLVRPVPVFPTTHERDSLSLSLSLNFSMSSTFHGFNKGEGVISVV